MENFRLRVFRAVARHLNFRIAGEELQGRTGGVFHGGSHGARGVPAGHEWADEEVDVERAEQLAPRATGRIASV
jgi:hypothetical protein